MSGEEEMRLVWEHKDSTSDERARRRARGRLTLQSQMLADHLNEGLPPEFWAVFDLAMSIQVERKSLAAPGVRERDSFEPRVFEQWESLRALNDRLAPFKFHLQVVHYVDGSYGEEMVPEFELPDAIPISYRRLIIWTLELLSANRLDRIRRCSCCNKWIAAIRDDNRFCSIACRQRDFENRPEKREQRNAVRRKSYRNSAEREKNFFSRNGRKKIGGHK